MPAFGAGSSEQQRIAPDDCDCIGRRISGAQRTSREQLSPQRRALLERIPGWAWNKLDAQWEQKFNALLTYIGREGNALVPIGHFEAGLNLGNWVKVQRRNREQLSPERRERLESVGFVWRTR